MSNDIAIRIDNVKKVYKVYDQPINRLKEVLNPFGSKYHKEFTAIENITFEVKKGETVGIVGKNGSGKSTILKLITGIVQPTSGNVYTNGRIAALLELGAGFNPELTGIENIYMNGSIMGVSRAEMDKRLNSILSFAEIGEFVNRQVKTYSSGMFARLAFAVSINVDPDILIVDEALSVGDVKFQMKCISKMKEIRNNGTTILFVSHASEQIKRFCTRGIWLDSGKLRLQGNANTVVNAYEDWLISGDINEEMMVGVKTEADKEGPIRIEVDSQTTLLNKQEVGKVGIIKSVICDKADLKTFDALEINIEYEIFEKEVDSFLLGVAIYGNDRKYIFGPNTHLDKVNIPNNRGLHSVTYKIPKIPLLSGTYSIDVGIFSDAGIVCIDYKNDAEKFYINSEYFTEGLVFIDHEWGVKG